MNAVIYSRVASHDQTNFENLENQTNALLTYCKDNNIEVVKQFEEVFSGFTFNRPEWRKLIDFVNKNEVNTIVVTSWTRLSRNCKLVSEMLARLEAINLHVKSTDNSNFSGLIF